MTVNEAASALGVTPSTVRNQIENGVIAATKVGRDWSITEEAVEEYRRDHRGKRSRPNLREPATVALQRESLKRPETRAKMSAAKLGRPLPREHVAKISAALSRRGSPSAETRERIAAPQRGRPKTESHKAAIHRANERPEVREHRSASQRGKTRSAEHRAKISRTKTGVPLAPGHAEKVSRGQARAYHEGRRGMSRLEVAAAAILTPLGFEPFPWIAGHGFDFASADGTVVVEVNACRIHDHRLTKPTCPFTPWGKAAADDRYRTIARENGLTLIELWECEQADWETLVHR